MHPFVGIVVESAIWISVTFQLFGYAKGIVGATEVLPARFIAIVAANQGRNFNFRPHSPEASPSSYFIGRSKPDIFNLKYFFLILFYFFF